MKTIDPNEQFVRLAKVEGWEVARDEAGEPRIWVDEKGYRLKHPYQIYLQRYRDETDIQARYDAMRGVTKYLWPSIYATWHKWIEEKCLVHLGGYKIITLAGGAGCGKSHDAALIGLIFWLSDPKANACVIASTTLDAIESRIWGYVTTLLSDVQLPVPFRLLTSKPAKVLYPGQMDKIHGIFAAAVKQGDPDVAIGNIIGRHPKKRLMVILDEATDMNPGISTAVPNLEKGVEFFQLWAIGNSNSKNDLHGALSTPLGGWESVDPMRDSMWPTKQERGVCLYFNPLKSPAIHDPDPVKRALLSRFLATKESIERDKASKGENSDGFWRFTMGFWRSISVDETGMSEMFLTENQVQARTEWSGFYPLKGVAGLDPAFQVGGEGCMLSLAIMGQAVDGKVVLDFRKEQFLFPIDIDLKNSASGERQLAERVAEIIHGHGIPLRALSIDCTGVGRALPELIRLVMKTEDEPWRFVSTRAGTKKGETHPSIIVTDPTELWLTFRSFVTHRQIGGLDWITFKQLTSRLLKSDGKKLILETKSDYKTRMAMIDPLLARSPDEADSRILTLQSAIRTYGFHLDQRLNLPTADPLFRAKALVFEHERRELIEKTRKQVEAEADARARPKIVANFSSPLEFFVKEK